MTCYKEIIKVSLYFYNGKEVRSTNKKYAATAQKRNSAVIQCFVLLSVRLCMKCIRNTYSLFIFFIGVVPQFIIIIWDFCRKTILHHLWHGHEIHWDCGEWSGMGYNNVCSLMHKRIQTKSLKT